MLLSRLRDQRGSMTMSLLFTMIAATIGMGLTASILAGFRTTRFDQSYEIALQRAEVGVERLADQVRKQTPSSPFNASRAVTDVPGLVTQVQQLPNGWRLTGIGTEAGVTRAVHMQITARSLFGYGVFADEGIKMVGSPPKVESYDTSIWGKTGTMGTNAPDGSIHTTHALNTTRWYDLGLDFRSDDAVQFIYDACEGKPRPNLTLSGTTATIPAGDHCITNLAFLNKSKITVTGTGPARLYVFGTISYGSNVQINCPSTGCIPGHTTRPDATRLQIYTPSESGIILGKGLRMAGALFAPRAECTTSPFVQVFGAMTCRTAQLQRAKFELHYDERLGQIRENYTTQWKEE
jgi:hypothetical protein